MKPFIEGETKEARGIPEMWEVVFIMRTDTMVCEEGMWRFGGGRAAILIFGSWMKIQLKVISCFYRER